MPNEFFIDDYTSELNELIREVVNDPATYMGAKWMPSRTIMTNRIRGEVLEASGGVTQEHVVGTDPKTVRKSGSRVQEYMPGFYKEEIIYDENDILFLRQMGQNDPSRRGIRQYIDNSIDRLNRRIEARIELERWDALLNGQFSYLGKTVSFGVPAGNRVTPVGAVWSTDGINANNAANPLTDMRYWMMGGYAPYRKYTINEIVMNPNTARWFLDNSNVRSYVTNAIANPVVKQYDVNDVLGFYIPGCPKVTVYKGWYQQESVVNNVLTVGNAVFFIPDGYIYFDVTPFGDTVGSFDQTLQLAGGTIESPAAGKFLSVEECIAPGTRGGPRNPFISVLGGVYGGPNLRRSFDLLTGYVGP